MDTHSNRPEDLTAVESRLSAWQPAREGLDADAVLFAAGRASVRPGPVRFVWPALTVLMTALTGVLGLWLADERSERVALARQLQERPLAPAVNPSILPTSVTTLEESPSTDELPADSYLSSRRALEEGLDAWPSRVVVRSGPIDTSFTNPPILRVGQRDALPEP